MSHKRNSAGIISCSKEKSYKSIKAADAAIRRLLFDKQAINFNTVAKAAGVSKTFLYENDGLRKRIEDLRGRQSQAEEPKHLKQRMSDASKDALIAVKNKRIADLEAENKRLKSILSKKLGEEYDNL